MDASRHEFVLPDFATDSGTVLRPARLVYGTFGRLNAARDNAVLLPSHYMADLHGYDWLIGPGRALDPEQLFIVCTELFGNGRSSSPSNTAGALQGPAFPVTTIGDNVRATHRLLSGELGIDHLRAVIGFSMGAQQAFQWAVSHPGFMDRIVATAGAARTYGHGFVRLEGQIAALSADAAFEGGHYRAPPERGLQAFALVWTGWLFTQAWWRQELWRTEFPPPATLADVIAHYRTRFIPGADANDLILQCRTWQQHDVAGTPPFAGDLAAALGSVRVPVLYMPCESDLYFPIDEARAEAALIPQCTWAPIRSPWGHPAGAGASPADAAFVNAWVAAFMAGGPLPSPGAIS